MLKCQNSNLEKSTLRSETLYYYHNCAKSYSIKISISTKLHKLISEISKKLRNYFMKLGSHKKYFKCDFKTILALLFIVMKKAFVELCDNVSMTLLLGLGFISQAANFVRA